jgi:death-on-curing protein
VTEPVWIEMEAILALHDRSLALHGGAEGVRDHGLLESALVRPRDRYHYEGVEDVIELGAAYAIALSSNHPFADGDKRAAFLCLTLFLRLNGFRLVASQADAALTMLAVAAGRMDVPALTDWIRSKT